MNGSVALMIYEMFFWYFWSISKQNDKRFSHNNYAWDKKWSNFRDFEPMHSRKHFKNISYMAF